MDLLHVLLHFSFGVLQQVSLTLREYRVARRDGDRGYEWREVEREQKDEQLPRGQNMF